MEAINKILIVGGSGYIGHELVQQLTNAAYSVTVASRKPFSVAHFPKQTNWLQLDASEATQADWEIALTGFYAVIFAAGADDRSMPPAPAFDFFFAKNVLPIQRMMQAAQTCGVRSVAILGSYFSFFEKQNPGWRLAETHPYIRSRKQQWQTALSFASPDLSVVVLEIPYVVGASPHVMPLWQPLVKFVNWGPPLLFYSRGGTAVVSLPVLAQQIIHRLESKESGCFPTVEENMRWQQFLSLLQKNPARRLRILYVPKWLVKAICEVLTVWWKIRGRESGLHAPAFVEMQYRELFLPLEKTYDKQQIRLHLRKMTEQCLSNFQELPV